MSRFIKLTLLIGLSVALVTALYEGWQHGVRIEIVPICLGVGLCTGLALACYTNWHLRRLQRLGIDTRQLPLRPRRRLILDGEPAVVQAACRAALSSLTGARVVEEEGVRFSARTPFTIRSFGESVRLGLVSQQAGACEVELSSRPVLVTTLLDYGKNLENVEMVTRALAAQLPCRPVA